MFTLSIITKASWWGGGGYYLFRIFKRSKIVKPIFLWSILIYAIAWIIYRDTATDVLIVIVSFGFQLLFAMFFMVIQFAAIFLFMAQSRTTIIRPGDPKTISFSDYYGQPALVKMMKEWLILLRDRGQFVKMGGKPISGILLSGQPGTGKTLLAKAMAGEGGVAFIGVEGSGFQAMFMGVSTLKVISLFKKARELAKEYGAAILYIDEIDSVGMSRGGVQGSQMMGGMMGMGGGSQALTRILYEMDGLGEVSEWDMCQNTLLKFLGLPLIDQGVLLVMGSTNRPDVLDPALVRPGRFDRTIQVDPPDRTGRREVIEGYLGKIQHQDVDVDALVADTAWATPAKIASALLKDSVRIALFSGRDYVIQRDIEMAMMEQAMGLQNPIADLEPEQKQQVAIHESGHAIVQYYLRPDERIVHLTITRRTAALGFMLPVPLTDIYTLPLDMLTADIQVGLAGHVAVILVLGRPWTGAGGDLQAIRYRIDQLAQYGMFGAFPMGSETNSEIQKNRDAFLKRCLKATEDILREHRAELDALTTALLEKNDLSGAEVLEIIERAKKENLT